METEKMIQESNYKVPGDRKAPVLEADVRCLRAEVRQMEPRIKHRLSGQRKNRSPSQYNGPPLYCQTTFTNSKIYLDSVLVGHDIEL